MDGLKKKQMGKSSIYSDIIKEHNLIQEKIKSKGKTRKSKKYYATTLFDYDLNEKCQRHLNLLSDITCSLQTKEPKILTKCKNKVFKTLGYCVGENL